jgi:hypothetical protein
MQIVDHFPPRSDELDKKIAGAIRVTGDIV